MSATSVPSTSFVPADQYLPSSLRRQLPEILSRAGKAAVFAADEFFFGRIRNEHTRAAYLHAVSQFLTWAEAGGLELVGITPKNVGQYFDELRKKSTSIATRKQHLAALRHFFDGLVTRHAIILNPALSVRGERFQVVEGKSREIPVRHDLEQMLFAYIEGARLRDGPMQGPLFRTAYRKTGRLTENGMHVVDVCRMVKRRLKDAGLRTLLSPHSFRVTTITDLLEQGVALEDVQRLAGHADPRTTRLYDRRQKKITRNIVERISI